MDAWEAATLSSLRMHELTLEKFTSSSHIPFSSHLVCFSADAAKRPYDRFGPPNTIFLQSLATTTPFALFSSRTFISSLSPVPNIKLSFFSAAFRPLFLHKAIAFTHHTVTTFSVAPVPALQASPGQCKGNGSPSLTSHRITDRTMRSR